MKPGVIRRVKDPSDKEMLTEKMAMYGTAVVCTSPGGYIIEGNVVEIRGWKHQYDESDGLDAHFMIRDHEDDSISYWRPSMVEFLGRNHVL